MRLPLLVLAVLATATPAAGRAEDPTVPAATLAGQATAGSEPGPALAPPAGAPARVEIPAIPEMTPDVARQRAANADADSRAAEASGLPLPASTVKEGAEAKAALAAHADAGKRGLPRWGLAAGAGFPDFGTVSLVFRPVSQIRLSGGPAWNYLGWGIQGGVAVVPWSFFVSPVLSFEAGRFFRTDLSFLAKDGGGVPSGMKSLLDGIDYSYAALDLGLEFGNQRGFNFALKLGLAWVSIAANGTATYDGKNGAVVTISDPALRATLPSAKLAFQYWF